MKTKNLNSFMSEVFKEALRLYKEEKYTKAFRLFLTGSEQGDSRCTYALGVCYFNGFGVDEDEEKGKELILESIDGLEKLGKENVYRANMLIYLAYNNFDFLNDDKKRFEALNRLYKHQKDEIDAGVLFDYAKCFQDERGVPGNRDKAHDLFRDCFEEYDDLESLYEFASYYLFAETDTYTYDPEYAIELLNEGAKRDGTNEQIFRFELFSLYFGGDLDSKIINYKLAEQIAKDALSIVEEPAYKTIWYLYLFMAASMQNKAQLALDSLGKVDFESYNDLIALKWTYLSYSLCLDGDFKNLEQVNNQILKKLQNYDVEPFFTMYCFYNNHYYHHKEMYNRSDDYLKKKSIQMLEEGVKHKETACMEPYARAVIIGDGIDKNVNKGFELIKKSCETTKDSISHVLLGECYENGLGSLKNNQMAYQSYKAAFDCTKDIRIKSQAAFHILFLSKYLPIPSNELKVYQNHISLAPNHSLSVIFTLRDNQINADNRDFVFWLSDYAYKHLGDGSYLAECYRFGIGTETNIKKAIELFEEDTSPAGGDYLREIGEMYYLGNETAKDLDLAEKYFLKSNCQQGRFYIRKSDIYLFQLYSDKTSKKYNLQKALERLVNASKEDKDNDYYLDEAFYLFGRFYQTKEYGMRDLKLAKEYYEKAKEHGLNCQYAIDSINKDIETEEFFAEGKEKGKKEGLYGYELEKFATNYAREKYAKTTEKGIYSFVTNLLHMNVDAPKRMFYIENELADDFGEIWNDLNSNSKISMITAINTYSAFIEMGYDVYSKMDFSQVINGLSKSFEIELKEFFYSGFLKYLKHNNTDCEEFVNECAKQQLPFIDEQIQIGKEGYPVRSYSYREEGDDKGFSIGQVYFIINFGHGNRYFNSVIDRSRRDLGIETRKAALSGEKVNNLVVEYFDTIFSSDAFVDANRKEEIANYLIDLANDIKIIQSRRNPATHETIMTFDEAELCADYLIKIRKIFFGFMNKIKKKYRKGFYIED